MIKVSAPCKIILFGEHAVVYDKLGIAGAIDDRITVTIKNSTKGVTIHRPLAPKLIKSNKEDIFEKLKTFEKLFKEQKFDEIKKMSFSDTFLVLLGKLFVKYGYKNLDIKIEFKNAFKGIGKSAAKYSAIVLGVSKLLGKKLSKKEIADLALFGDMVAHGGTPSGIDTSTVTYGGYISYRKSEGVKPIDVKIKMPLIIIDSGELAKTSETVPYVRKQMQENASFVNIILNDLDDISQEALNSLKKGDLKRFGGLMYEYYEELRKLNISTDRLDEIVAIAKKNDALGAKPTGGWGGGTCIVLAKDSKHAEKLLSIFKDSGFKALSTKLGAEGVKVERHKVKVNNK